MQIVSYSAQYRQEWNRFNDQARNGTFLFDRNYMEYHSDRFRDASFLFYQKGKLVALLPGNLSPDGQTYYSHQGLTYGGLVLSSSLTAAGTLQIFDELLSYLKQTFATRQVVYKPVPHIYHRYPAEEDLYALFRHNARLEERKISSTLRMENRLAFTQSRKGGVSKALRSGLVYGETDHAAAFWKVLEHTLQVKHGAHPVHSLGEMMRLKSLFPGHIRFYEVRKEEKVIAGCVIYEVGEGVHVQYIAADEEGKSLGALDLLFSRLLEETYACARFFDFGTSVEQGGRFLNEGLIFQKEGFGARATMYDTYIMEIP